MIPVRSKFAERRHPLQKQTNIKQPCLELLARGMREFHLHQPLILAEGGPIVQYSYTDIKPHDSSQWDGCCYVVNGRRFMVSRPGAVHGCPEYQIW